MLRHISSVNYIEKTLLARKIIVDEINMNNIMDKVHANSISRCLELIILVSVVLCGCRRGNTDSNVEDCEYEVIHTEMQYFDFDKVESLTAFFDSISVKHTIPIWIEEDEEAITKDVFGCIKRIEGYRQGKNKYYPDSLVRSCIDFFGFNSAIIDNHGPGVDMTYAEWFLMLVAFYSPDISYLVDMQTPNHKAGILNFGQTYNSAPWWSYIFLKRDVGFEVRKLHGDYTKINKIFQVEDDSKHLYYLCSNNQPIEFLQILFFAKNEDDIVQIAICDSIPSIQKEFDCCYYNPDQKAWYCCNVDEHSGKLIPISETPILKLELTGNNSRFTIPQ